MADGHDARARAPPPIPRSRWIYEWLTTTDHKKIGVDVHHHVLRLLHRSAASWRWSSARELAVPGLQFVTPSTYNQLFRHARASTMIFLFVMPMTTGLANYIVPLQIGAADMAFPRINALSFWMVPLGGLLLYSGFAFGGAPTPAGPCYAPLSEQSRRPGVDLLLLGLDPARHQLRSWAPSTSWPRSSRCARRA